MPVQLRSWSVSLTVLLAAAAPVIAQDTPMDRHAAYAALAQLPPMEGLWQADRQMVLAARQAEVNAPLTEVARARQDAFYAARARGENVQTQAANCLPVGLPGSMRLPYPFELIYSPGKVNLLIETDGQIRQIFTDGRPLPDDPDPFFNGNSIGHWEGDALVVETVGLNPRTHLIEGISPTTNTRIIERFKLESADRLLVETTIIDPALFTTPYTTQINYRREAGWTLREFFCAENNRDGADAQGRATMDLGLDDPFDEFDPFSQDAGLDQP